MRLTNLLAACLLAALVASAGSAAAYDPEFDYNADGVVDQADIDLLMAHLGLGEADPEFDPTFDHDGDGYIGGTDVALAFGAVSQ